MLRHGNAGCHCKHKSLFDIIPGITPPAVIAQRLDFLKITSSNKLKGFDSHLYNQLKDSLEEIAEHSKHFKLPNYLRTQHLTKEELLELLGKAENNRELHTKYKQSFDNYLKKGGTTEELYREYPWLRPKSRIIPDNEKDYHYWANVFLKDVEEDPNYSFHDFYQDYDFARNIYPTTTNSGFPATLVIAEYVRKKTRKERKNPVFVELTTITKEFFAFFEKSEENALMRLFVIAQIAKKRQRDIAPTCAPTSSKANVFDLPKSFNLSRHIKKLAILSQENNNFLCKEVKRSLPPSMRNKLTKSMQIERIKELIYEYLGAPKSLLNHQKRGTTTDEIIYICKKEGIKIANEFRMRYWNYYAWSTKGEPRPIDEIYRALGWGGRYISILTGTITSSTHEAITANVLHLLHFVIEYDQRYKKSDRRFRYDFRIRIGKKLVHIEVYQFERNSKKAKQGNSYAIDYLKNREDKESFINKNHFRVVAVEAEQYYGTKSPIEFARYINERFKEQKLTNTTLSDQDIKLATTAVSHAKAEPEKAIAELKKHLINHYKLTSSEANAILEAIPTHKGRLDTILCQEKINGDFFDYISRKESAFVVVRRLHDKPDSKHFSDSKYTHWANALLAAIHYKENNNFYKLPRSRGGQAPFSDVWYLHIRDGTVLITDKNEADLHTIEGNSIEDKVTRALRKIEKQYGQIELVKPIIKRATEGNDPRVWVLKDPTEREIKKLARHILSK